MKRIILATVLVVMSPAVMRAQASPRPPRGQTYLFIGGATHQMGATAGFGGEVYFFHGLGAGVEVATAGFNTSTLGNPNWIGLGSADASYHFFLHRSHVAPFLAGGYTNFFGQDVRLLSGVEPGRSFTNGYNIGGGVDLLATKHVGFRFDVRYYGHGGRVLWPSFPTEAQLHFVAFRVGLTLR